MEQRETIFTSDQVDTEITPYLMNPAAIETWLEDKAQDGWQLTGFDYRFWRTAGDFRRADPRPTRYRLTPLTRKETKPDGERLELCEAQGWHYAATLTDRYHVWRTDDEDALEMDTDPATQAEGYRYLRRKAWWAYLWLIPAALVGIIYLLPYAGLGVLMRSMEAPPGYVLILLIFAIALPVGITCNLLSLRRLYRQLHAGVPLDRPVRYRRRQVLKRALQIGFIVCYFYQLFSYNLFDLGEYKDISRDPEAMSRAKYVSLTDLGPLPEGTETELEVERKRTELYPELYNAKGRAYDPNGPGTREVSRTVESRYCRALTPRLAEGLMGEFVAEAAYWHEKRPERYAILDPCPAPELDSFYWGSLPIEKDDGRNVSQYAAARLGSRVLTVTYNGPENLREMTGVLAGILAEQTR